MVCAYLAKRNERKFLNIFSFSRSILSVYSSYSYFCFEEKEPVVKILREKGYL